ncbi:MAG: DUF3489 domain-containing protein [Roseiarcus sp.]
MSKQLANSKFSNVKLSDTQLVMMSAAAQREDRCLVAPQNLKGAAARKVAEKLVDAGLVREIRAKPGMSAWRRDEEAGQSYALKLAAAGLNAIAVDEEVDAEEAAAEASNADSQVQPTKAAAQAAAVEPADRPASSQNAAPVSTAAAPRAGSKLAEVVGLLCREGGASIDELIVATDWLPHTTRAALTGLRKRGYSIERRREGVATRYWLASPGIHGARGADESISNAGSSGIGGSTSVGARIRPAKAA